MWKKIPENLSKGDIISFVGGGGKTTIMFRIARMLAKNGHKVLVTTTTKIYDVDDHMYEKYVLRETITDPKAGRNIGITVFGEKVQNQKLIGPSTEALKEYIDSEGFDFVLIEADGSRKKSIKAYKTHEPVVPEFCNVLIAVVSLDVIGCVLTEAYVYNAEGLSKILGKSIREEINASDIAKSITSHTGLLKTCGKKKKMVVLTKCCNKERVQHAINIAESIKSKDKDTIIYTSY